MEVETCDNCLKSQEGLRVKKLEKCSHSLCPSCSPHLLKRLKKLKRNQSCPVCAKEAEQDGGDEFFIRINRPQSTKSTKSVQLCAICTDSLTDPISLPCKHRFCKECFDKWEERSSTCPMCRKIVNEDKQRRIEEARMARRAQRRQRAGRNVHSPFPDPVFNTGGALVIMACFILFTASLLLVAGVFAVRYCHALMFTGFPFWTGLHMVIIASLTLVIAFKPSPTAVIVQIILAGFAIIFSVMSLCIAGFQLKFTLNNTISSRCEDDSDIREPLFVFDVALIAINIIAVFLSCLLIFVSMVTLGANPGILCLRKFFVPSLEPDHPAMSHYREGQFFPAEPVISTITIYEKVVNIFTIIFSTVVLGAAVAAFLFCHSFRVTGLFLWSPMFQILFAIFHFFTFHSPTWCKITSSMILSSFASLIAFIMMCFGTAQLSLSYAGDKLEGNCSHGPHPEIDVILVAGSLILVILNFLATRCFSNHLSNPTRVEPT